MRTKKIKIGVDIDGVLADFVNHFLGHYNEKNGTNFKYQDVKTFNFEDVAKVPSEVMDKELDTYMQSDEFSEIQPLKDSIKHINILEAKYELIIITSRPTYLVDETKRWLKHYYKNSFKHVLFSKNVWTDDRKSGNKSKAELCMESGVNIMIEDGIEYALDISAKEITVLLVDSPWNQKKDLPNNVIRVHDWNEILIQIQKISNNKI